MLANHFNSAYYLLLITGNWSGGETSKGLTLLGCGRKAPKCRAPKVLAADVSREQELRSLFYFGSGSSAHRETQPNFYRLL